MGEDTFDLITDSPINCEAAKCKEDTDIIFLQDESTLSKRIFFYAL